MADRYSISWRDYGLWRQIRHLSKFLDGRIVLRSPLVSKDGSTAIGWGRKPSGSRAQGSAGGGNRSFALMEEGFLRSLGLAVHGFETQSLVLDRLGIYYDSTVASELECMIRDGVLDESMHARARRCMALIRENRLSKYNHAPDTPLFQKVERRRVLVVDQTVGDASIVHGGGNSALFDRMLDAALRENPDAEVVVKIHPDVIAGKKQGYLLRAARDRACRILTDDVNPWALFDGVERVYVVTSQLGFEALMADKPVVCFGLPFYAGWGVTDDRQTCVRRCGRQRSLEQLFYASYIRYSRYVNPYTGSRCQIEETIWLLSDQRRHLERFRGPWVAAGFPLWKRRFVASFLGMGAEVIFKRNLPAASSRKRPGERLLVWSKALSTCSESSGPVLRMEDGFIRSVGLGADLVRPMSLVIDATGIYYDATATSDLEQILTSYDFSKGLLERAQAVRQKIVDLGLSKYNVGEKRVVTRSAGKRIILVPGQVETDASITWGSPQIQTNQALLEVVRRENPDAWIIYKPHPDVLSGARRGTLPGTGSDPFDEQVCDVAMSDLLDQVDEVHTMSSLSGFEALLRGIRVETYGVPFYAGWGLTHDRLECRRRTRRLTLDQLVAGALILYPTYVDPVSRQVCSIETIIELIHNRRMQHHNLPFKTRFYRFYRNLFEEVR